MQAPMQYSNASTPLVALVALIIIVLICRWVFGTGERDARTARRLARARSRGDYGLLVPVVAARTRRDAEVLRDVLKQAGIRGTLAPGEPSPVVPAPWLVLVFRVDANRARALVSSS